MIDAAVEAGVKHFIPSEFGSNVSGNSKVAALPVFAGKVKTQEYLKTKSSEISWTVIVNGFFFDWGLDRGFLVDRNGGTTKVYDDPDAKHSFTLLSDVGKAVAGVLKHPEETKNRTVYIQSTAASQNQLLDIVKKRKAGGDVEKVDTEKLLQDAHGLLKKGGADIGTAYDFHMQLCSMFQMLTVRCRMISYIIVSIFGKDYGNLWSDKNENKLLGITELSQEEVEKIVLGPA